MPADQFSQEPNLEETQLKEQQQDLGLDRWVNFSDPGEIWGSTHPLVYCLKAGRGARIKFGGLNWGTRPWQPKAFGILESGQGTAWLDVSPPLGWGWGCNCCNSLMNAICSWLLSL